MLAVVGPQNVETAKKTRPWLKLVGMWPRGCVIVCAPKRFKIHAHSY